MNLDELLSNPEPVKKQEKDPLFGINTLQLTNYAYEKAYAYARLACEVHGDSIECGGYLVKRKDSEDRVAEDAFLARDQDVQAGLFTINAEDVIKAGRELDKNGYKVLGWWHSHGYLKTFFSQLDDSGQMTCLNEISAFNYVTQSKNYEISDLETKLDGNKLILWDKKSPAKKYEIEFLGKNKLAIARMAIADEKRVGFSYGLVVNAKNKKKKEPYAEIAVRDLCNQCRRAKDISLEVEVELFEDDKKVEIDDDKLRKEIKDRVKMPRKFFGGFFGGGGKSWFGGSTPVYSGGKLVGYSDGKGNYSGTGYVSKGTSGRTPTDSIDDIECIKEVSASTKQQESQQELEERIRLFCQKNPSLSKGDMDVKDNGTWLSYRPSGSNSAWKYLCGKRDLPHLPTKAGPQKQLPLEEKLSPPSQAMQDYVNSVFDCGLGPEVISGSYPTPTHEPQTPPKLPQSEKPGLILPTNYQAEPSEQPKPISEPEKPVNKVSNDPEVEKILELCLQKNVDPKDIEEIGYISGQMCFKLKGKDCWI